MIDIVDRLKFDATRCEAQFSRGVAGNIDEAADEIERLRKALELIACRHVTENPLWWQKLAREALTVPNGER